MAAASLLALAAWAAPAQAASLPDNRVMELVSPADTGGNLIAPTLGSSDGSRALMASTGGLADEDTVQLNTYLATRTPTGWEAHFFKPKGSPFGDLYIPSDANADLTRFVAQAIKGSGFSPTASAYVTVDEHGNEQKLIEYDPNDFSSQPTYGGKTPDVEHVYFAVPTQLVPEDTHTSGGELYDLGGVGGADPKLVGILPDGTVPDCGSALAGAPSFGAVKDRQHAVSEDGSRVAFVTPDPSNGSCGFPAPPPHLYLRDGNTTRDISTPISGSDEGARFIQATEDVSRIIFVTANKLVAEDTNSSSDIYEYTVGEGNTCLTCGYSTAAQVDASNVAASEDGSHVYFVSHQDLDSDHPGGGLYLLSGGQTKFVAKTFQVSATPGSFGNSGQLTPDGRTLLFTSTENLTGYDSGGRSELYRYTEDDDTVVCVSCRPDGKPATADVVAGGAGGFTLAGLDPSAMTADGRTIVFQTPDPLVTEDTNFAPGTFSPQGWDVYEWHDGTLSLLTDGTTPSTSSSDNVFTNITPDGRDVFLFSFDKLAPQEISHTGAIYDARIGGGFPVPTPPAECRDDGCQGPASPQPELPLPASVSFSGPGDVSAAGTSTFRVARISGSAQRRLARTGRITLSVRVPDEGTVEATASARVKGLLARVARASRHASRASTVHVTLKLSTAARRELARRHRLTVRFVVRFSELPGSATATVTLRQARSSANARHTATRKGR